MSRVCLLATPRSGSTWMTKVLAYHLNGVCFTGPHAEIFNPFTRIETMLKMNASSPDFSDLLEAWTNAAFPNQSKGPFIFKTFPHFHSDVEHDLSRPEITVIRMVRRKVASQVASYMVSWIYREWKLQAAEQGSVLVYGPKMGRLLDYCLLNIMEGNREICKLRIKSPLIFYEDVVAGQSVYLENFESLISIPPSLAVIRPSSYRALFKNAEEFYKDYSQRIETLMASPHYQCTEGLSLDFYN